MIQRIQSVYLLLTIILSGLFLTGRIYTSVPGNAAEMIMNFSGFYAKTNGDGEGYEMVTSIIPFSLISCLIPVTALVAFFLFKKRILQLKTTLVLIILEVLLIVSGTIYGYDFINRHDASLIPGYRMFIPVIILVLSIMAYSRIRKDENLVRSYDRLR